MVTLTDRYRYPPFLWIIASRSIYWSAFIGVHLNSIIENRSNIPGVLFAAAL
jgi:hypothetical protein